MVRAKKTKTPNYKSKFEVEVANKLGDLAIYEPDKLKFIQPPKNRNYCPDFKLLSNGI